MARTIAANYFLAAVSDDVLSLPLTCPHRFISWAQNISKPRTKGKFKMESWWVHVSRCVPRGTVPVVPNHLAHRNHARSDSAEDRHSSASHRSNAAPMGSRLYKGTHTGAARLAYSKPCPIIRPPSSVLVDREARRIGLRNKASPDLRVFDCREEIRRPITR